MSLAKSRYVLPSQFVFLGTNALGLILGTIYNASTPDLFPNNAHHRIGWVITWVISAQVVVSLLRRVGGALKGADSELAEEHRSFIPLPTDAPEARAYYGDRLSNDSGQGSEPTTESLRSNSISTLGDHEHQPMSTFNKELDEEDDFDGPIMPMPEAQPQSKTTLVAIKVLSSKVWKYIDFGYKAVDRIILPFGFIAYTSGIATYGRLFVRFSLFSLPNWKKNTDIFFLGGHCDFQWTCSLDQGRNLLLDGSPDSGSLGGKLLRIGLVMESASSEESWPALGSVCRIR